ncbi:MAG: HAMP domain-containing histidine kinase [Ruminococcus sp.]|nr:HAMP domain-containing histidine kinase [Ruminococcus sp.]
MNNQKIDALKSMYAGTKSKVAIYDQTVTLLWTNDEAIFSSVKNDSFYTPEVKSFGHAGKAGLSEIKEECTAFMKVGDLDFSVLVKPVYKETALDGFVVETCDFYDYLLKTNTSYNYIAIRKYLSLARETASSVAFTEDQICQELEVTDQYDLADKTKQLLNPVYKLLASVANLEELMRYVDSSFNTTTFNLSSYTENSLYPVRSKLAFDAITLNCEIEKDIYVRADADRYFVVLLNLITNAIMYNISEKKIITVRVTSNGDNAIVSVTDNGIGLSETARRRMNIAFAMSDLTKPNESLGFEILKLFCRQFSASFSYMTREDEGTTISLQIPKTKPREVLRMPRPEYPFSRYSPVDIYLHKTKI